MGNKLEKLKSRNKFEKDCIEHIFDVETPRENSGSILKIVVQCLYHLRPFKEPFMTLKESDHDHTKDCAFCPLSLLFTSLQFGSDGSLGLKEVEANLSETFKGGKEGQKKITFKQINDGCEAFEELIKKLCKNVDVTTFDLTVNEQFECEKCGYNTEPKTYISKVWYISGKELLDLVANNPKGKDKLVFEEMVKLLADGERKSCEQEKCKGSKKKEMRLVCKKYILSLPYVIPIAINWDEKELLAKNKKTAKKVKKQVFGLLSSLTPVVLPDQMFRMFDQECDKAARLTAIIAYSHQKYVGFHWDNSMRLWFMSSEKDVQPLGRKWKDVRKKMFEVHAFPTLLFYTLVNRKHDIIKVPNDI